MAKYTEPDLIKPVLTIIAQNNSPITMPEIQSRLRPQLTPSSYELEILKNRNDYKLSQKIRNLKCHKTLEKAGLVTYLKDNPGRYLITEKGRAYLLSANDNQSFASTV